MGTVADITDLVMPKIKKAREEGMEKGIEKGREKTAEAMLKKSFSISEVSEITGFSVKKIKSL